MGEWKQSFRKRGNYIVQTLDRSNKITHSYLLEGKQQPMSYAYQTKYTMKHILIECSDQAHIRKTFYSANNMKELFQKTEINDVISFPCFTKN